MFVYLHVGAAVNSLSFTDIHCHLIPAIDDGSTSWNETLLMAKIAVADGTGTIIATPHQLGQHHGNDAAHVRQASTQVQTFLHENNVPLRVLPGGDVRIEDELVAKLRAGNVITLADRGRHVLLELPHELYFPLEPLLSQLRKSSLTGILSHPERNYGLQARRPIVRRLVHHGCLMQITAGSIVGSFGPQCRDFAEWMLRRGLVHFVATDAHGAKTRRPALRKAFHRVCQLVGRERATEFFCRNPASVAAGLDVPSSSKPATQGRFGNWFKWPAAG